MKSIAIATPQRVQVRRVAGVGDDGVDRVGELRGGRAALLDGVLVSRSPDCTSTGTSGIARPRRGEPAVGSAGQSRHFGPGVDAGAQPRVGRERAELRRVERRERAVVLRRAAPRAERRGLYGRG